MPADVRVLFSNTYAMGAARLGWRTGVYPDHHLFGTAELPPGFVVEDLDYRPGNRLTRLREHSDVLGELDQQAQALHLARHGGEPSVVYSASFATLRGLCLARRAGLFRSPVVCVVHSVGPRGLRLQREMLAGCDRLIAMCEATRGLLTDQLRLDGGRIETLHWGPDAAFAPFADAPAPDPAGPVLSSGKTRRDTDTLVEALRRTGRPGRVYVPDVRAVAAPPANVELAPSQPPPRAPGDPASYDHVLADLRGASIVVIALRDAAPLHGITELDDALACGRPVVMTRVPYIDLDIEAEGVGVWVPEGDAGAIAEAIDGILGDPPRLAAMSVRAREVVRDGWNSRTFAAGVHRALAVSQA